MEHINLLDELRMVLNRDLNNELFKVTLYMGNINEGLVLNGFVTSVDIKKILNSSNLNCFLDTEGLVVYKDEN